MRSAKTKLIKLIDDKIEREIMKTGKMGTEVVSIHVDLTANERETFTKIAQYDTENYWWEFEGDVLRLSYYV